MPTELSWLRHSHVFFCQLSCRVSSSGRRLEQMVGCQKGWSSTALFSVNVSQSPVTSDTIWHLHWFNELEIFFFFLSQLNLDFCEHLSNCAVFPKMDVGKVFKLRLFMCICMYKSLLSIGSCSCWQPAPCLPLWKPVWLEDIHESHFLMQCRLFNIEFL